MRYLRTGSTVEWLPAVLAGLFLIALAIQMSDVINVVYRDSDAASAPVLAGLIDDAPEGREALLGNYPWYESLWFLQLTDGVPHQRLVWQGGPVILYFTTVALVAASAWAALGRRAGLLAAAVLVCLSTPARLVFLSPNFHAPTAAHAALLGAMLVVLARRAPLWHRWQLVLIAVVLGVITALGTASDDLILAVAIGPVVAAALALWVKDPAQRNVALCALGACAIALVLGGRLEQHMLENGIAPQQFTLAFLGGGDILERLEGLAQAFAALVGGDIFGREVDAASLLRLGALALAVSALVLIAFELRARLRAPGAFSRGTLASPAAGAFAHVTFWGLSAAGTIAAYVLGNTPSDAGAARYLGTLWLAIGALLGLLAIGARLKATAVGVGAALFVAIATVTLVDEGSDERPAWSPPQRSTSSPHMPSA